MNLSKVRLIYHTVKHLRFKQVYYRLFYTLRNRFFKRDYTKNLTTDIKPLIWNNIVCYNTSYLSHNTFNFLNIEHQFNEEIDWNYNEYGKLWTYNLNYFDFLNQEELTTEVGLKLIKNYLEQDGHLKDGKEPYPISLRTINWIKFLAQNQISDQRINQALYNHFQILLHNLEYHLLGNHLLENAFALFFGGVYFNDKRLTDKASDLLRLELEEQILQDGAHFELSPMYHQILLHRLLDCISLANQNKTKIDVQLLIYLRAKVVKMLAWLQTITFKNGSIPLVNDSADGIALDSNQLFNYGKKLGLAWDKVNLTDSGYRKFQLEQFELFIDVGQLAVTYQPGHAHADTFSFVLHHNKKAIIIDPGVSTYEINDIRKRERSTAYHNTVTVNDENSSQVWSGFRVAKRAEVHLETDEARKVVAIHNGFSNCKHARTFNLENNNFGIEDSISTATKANAHFHFHPDSKVKKIDNKLIVNNVELTFINHENIEIEEYHFAKGFNTTIIAKKVVVLFTEKLRTEIKVIP